MEFKLLGPLEVTDGGRTVPTGGAKQRSLLALLVLNAGKVVTLERIVEELWGEDPPDSAANAVQVYVANLRKVLDPERAQGAASDILVTRTPGYLLRIKPEDVDLLRFEDLTEQARRHLEDDPEAATALLRKALALWRGPALAGIVLEGPSRGEIPRLEELRISALEDRIQGDLEMGRHAALVAELEALVAAHPVRERLHAQRMLALYRCGRQAEALKAYREARHMLAEELGIDPCVELQSLERAMLQQDPALAAPVRIPAKPSQVAAPRAEEGTTRTYSQPPRPTFRFQPQRPSDEPATPAAAPSNGDAGPPPPAIGLTPAHGTAIPSAPHVEKPAPVAPPTNGEGQPQVAAAAPAIPFVPAPETPALPISAAPVPAAFAPPVAEPPPATADTRVFETVAPPPPSPPPAPPVFVTPELGTPPAAEPIQPIAAAAAVPPPVASPAAPAAAPPAPPSTAPSPGQGPSGPPRGGRRLALVLVALLVLAVAGGVFALKPWQSSNTGTAVGGGSSSSSTHTSTSAPPSTAPTGAPSTAPTASVSTLPFPTAAEAALLQRFPSGFADSATCHRFARHYSLAIAEVDCPIASHPGITSIVYQQFKTLGDMELHYHHVLALDIQTAAGRPLSEAGKGACSATTYFMASTYSPQSGAQTQSGGQSAHGHFFCYTTKADGVPHLVWTNVGWLVVAQATGEGTGSTSQGALLEGWQFAGPVGDLPAPASAQTPEQQITELYHRYFNRNPESPEAIQSHVAQIQQMGYAGLANLFADSSEGKALAGGVVLHG